MKKLSHLRIIESALCLYLLHDETFCDFSPECIVGKGNTVEHLGQSLITWSSWHGWCWIYKCWCFLNKNTVKRRTQRKTSTNYTHKQTYILYKCLFTPSLTLRSCIHLQVQANKLFTIAKASFFNQKLSESFRYFSIYKKKTAFAHLALIPFSSYASFAGITEWCTPLSRNLLPRLFSLLPPIPSRE